MVAAIALLPAGGTVFGFAMPYWTPISPLLFLLYAVLNVRLLPQVSARYGALLLFPLGLVAVSAYMGGSPWRSTPTWRSKRL